jgi:hypothetical protein
MNNLALRRTFVLFHCTLAIVVFAESMQALLHALNSGHKHIALLAGPEALACVLFVVPKTLKIGAIALLGIFAIALIVHGLQGEIALLVYGTGVLFVMVHGAAFGRDLFHAGV